MKASRAAAGQLGVTHHRPAGRPGRPDHPESRRSSSRSWLSLPGTGAGQPVEQHRRARRPRTRARRAGRPGRSSRPAAGPAARTQPSRWVLPEPLCALEHQADRVAVGAVAGIGHPVEDVADHGVCRPSTWNGEGRHTSSGTCAQSNRSADQGRVFRPGHPTPIASRCLS